jgi:hypothetical protein
MSGQISFETDNAKELLNELQKFEDAVSSDWRQVLNRWSSLKSVWKDQQFDKFEPLFENLSNTYTQVEQECEEYIDFLKHQIDIAETRKSKMGALDSL